MGNNGQQGTTMDIDGKQWATMGNNGKQGTTMDIDGNQCTTMGNNSWYVNEYKIYHINFN